MDERAVWLTDDKKVRLVPYFPKSHVKPRLDDRRMLSGIVFVNRSGLRWCDAPRVRSVDEVHLDVADIGVQLIDFVPKAPSLACADVRRRQSPVQQTRGDPLECGSRPSRYLRPSRDPVCGFSEPSTTWTTCLLPLNAALPT